MDKKKNQIMKKFKLYEKCCAPESSIKLMSVWKKGKKFILDFNKRVELDATGSDEDIPLICVSYQDEILEVSFPEFSGYEVFSAMQNKSLIRVVLDKD